jgi:predicted O-methyltransferase YrrM
LGRVLNLHIKTKEISRIAITGITQKRAELLFRITTYFEPDTILEIGTSLGLATTPWP